MGATMRAIRTRMITTRVSAEACQVQAIVPSAEPALNDRYLVVEDRLRVRLGGGPAAVVAHNAIVKTAVLDQGGEVVEADAQVSLRIGQIGAQLLDPERPCRRRSSGSSGHRSLPRGGLHGAPSERRRRGRV